MNLLCYVLCDIGILLSKVENKCVYSALYYSEVNEVIGHVTSFVLKKVLTFS